MVVAVDEQTGLAVAAATAVATVPCAADEIALLPLLLGGGNGDDFAGDLVTWDAGVGDAHGPELDEAIAVADAAGIQIKLYSFPLGSSDTPGLDLDQDLSVFGFFKLALAEGQLTALLLKSSDCRRISRSGSKGA
jgi:hypothetical protein